MHTFSWKKNYYKLMNELDKKELQTIISMADSFKW